MHESMNIKLSQEYCYLLIKQHSTGPELSTGIREAFGVDIITQVKK